MLGCMFPADRDPPPPAPAPPPAHPTKLPQLLDNPLVKAVWTREDLFLALVLAQVSSGRHGRDAVEAAGATLQAIDQECERANGNLAKWGKR